MMLGDVWLKIAERIPLTAQEMEFLRLNSDQTQKSNTIVGDVTYPSGALKTNSPIQKIYSEAILNDTSDSYPSVKIPNRFNNLFTIMAGNSSDAIISGGNFGSTQNNSTLVRYLNNNGAEVLDGSADGTIAQMGFLSGSGMFIAFLPNIQSGFYKESVSASVSREVTLGYVINYMNLFSNTWRSTEKIENFAYRTLDGTFTAGTIFTIYGLD